MLPFFQNNCKVPVSKHYLKPNSGSLQMVSLQNFKLRLNKRKEGIGRKLNFLPKQGTLRRRNGAAFPLFLALINLFPILV